MNYIRITEENIDSEHICCAMSGNSVDIVFKKLRKELGYDDR